MPAVMALLACANDGLLFRFCSPWDVSYEIGIGFTRVLPFIPTMDLDTAPWVACYRFSMACGERLYSCCWGDRKLALFGGKNEGGWSVIVFDS